MLKQHPVYEHLMISDQGEVFSKKTNKFLKLQTHGSGCIMFATRLHGRNSPAICFKVHRLVAQTFLPNLDNLPVVNHKNGNRADNRVENLEWCTYSYNSLHAYETGLSRPRRKEEAYNYKGSPEKIQLALELRGLGWTVKRVADLFAVSHVTVLSWLKTARNEAAEIQTRDLPGRTPGCFSL